MSLAQRGRSLGMHLILATQRPAGSINDNIRANTNLRISLRMNDRVDSEDVIGSPLAAQLPRSLPGRAYVRTGSDELEQIQMGYAGGHAFGGHRSAAFVTVLDDELATTDTFDGGSPGAAPPTDLMRLVEVIRRTHDIGGHASPRVPWLPELPDVLHADDPTPEAGTAVSVGIRDAPDRQAQDTHVIDLSATGGLLVAGSGGSGKTTLLRTLATRLAQQQTPADLHLYVLDFASRGLGTLGALPHCGGVIAGEDLERATRLLNTVDRWLTERRQRLAAAGVSNLDELRRIELDAGKSATPRIVILLDGYAAFAQAFEKIEYGAWLERLPLLVAEGRALGVHWVITAERRLTVTTALAAAFGDRFVLRLNDRDDYAAFDLDSRAALDTSLPPGRGLATNGDQVHVAILGTDPSGEAQLAAVERIAVELREQYPDTTVPVIRVLPDKVYTTDLPAPSAPGSAVVGLDDHDLAPITLDLDEGDILVAGPPRSGKSTALGTMIRSLRVGDPSIRSLLVAPRRTPLLDLPGWETVLRPGAQMDEAIFSLRDAVEVRGGDDAPLIVVVDDAHELADSSADAATP